MTSFFANLDPFLPTPGEPPVPYEQWKSTACACILTKDFHLKRLPTGRPQPGEQGAQQASVYSDTEEFGPIFGLGHGGTVQIPWDSKLW